MKKKICILAALIAAFGMNLVPASASLLGAPLNLKAALEAHEAQMQGVQAQGLQTLGCHFYTDDVFAGPVLISGC